jgi:crossover junction endodeoxyribonuclease RusA
MLTLPWPPSKLSPNQRLHFAVLAKEKAKYRQVCGLLAKAGIPATLPVGNIHLYITFHPPQNRAYDMDNLLARMKSGLDGVCDAWGINDKCFRPITINMGDRVKDGLVLIQIK